MKSISFLAIVTAFLFLLIPPSAAAATADDVKCTGCVGSPDILDGGVKHTDISNGAITAGKIKDGAINKNKIKSGAVQWEHLVADLQVRILELEAAVDTLQDALQDNTVLKLDGYLDLDTTDPSKPTALFAGVNVQVVNGLGQTSAVNELGNLLVGYDETSSDGSPVCSDGQWDTQGDCEASGEVWAQNHKSGSHNLVIGSGHRYSQSAGLVAGHVNTINRDGASVTGGRFNIASGEVSAVGGGEYNVANYLISAVSGGRGNTSSDYASVVSGGDGNAASEYGSVVSGGWYNNATGYWAVVSGGYNNTAEETRSVVSGGSNNTAAGRESVVGGGYDRTAGGEYDWVAGGYWQDQ